LPAQGLQARNESRTASGTTKYAITSWLRIFLVDYQVCEKDRILVSGFTWNHSPSPSQILLNKKAKQKQNISANREMERDKREQE